MKPKMKSIMALHVSQKAKAVKGFGALKTLDRNRIASARFLFATREQKQMDDQSTFTRVQPDIRPEIQKEIDDVVNETAKLTTIRNKEDLFKSLGI
ncbi:hypothetical protein ACFQ44_03285 [Levilactobacillus lanxiensis]|uniref:Uncharacterized protein n=1 Tax=Levilactobacillus lanxiensis TaxID=2799568 RepID=A0ABW4D3W4_9LACO|nr:hypothetical protein [Levilactobacillus lanxiensis]